MSLIDKVAGLSVDLVSVRGALTDRHEKYGRAAAGGIVHALLELNALLSDDSGVGDDVVGFNKNLITLKIEELVQIQFVGLLLYQ